jgi:hypothetical protein
LHAVEHPEEMHEMEIVEDAEKKKATWLVFFHFFFYFSHLFLFVICCYLFFINRDLTARHVKATAAPVLTTSSYGGDSEVQALVIDNGSGMSKVSYFLHLCH